MSSTTGFFGMRGTGDWTNEERPKSFREGLLYMYPNGKMPLTGITSKGKNKAVDDPEFKWFTKNLAARGGACAGAYEDLALGTLYAAGDAGSVGSLVYCKVAAAVVTHFRPGHVALLIDADDVSKYVVGKVVSMSTNGASSYVLVKLLKACDAGVLSAVDYIDIIGSVNPEGGTIPDGVSYDPSKYSNYTQIFRTPLSVTRTQQKTKMRTGMTYPELKREAYEQHGIDLELAILFGEKTELTGDNGQPERTSQGIRSFLKEHNSANILDYRSATATADLTWLQGGEDWLDESLEVLFRYGREEKLGIAGSGAILGIQKLVKSVGQYSISSTTAGYGINVVRWITPFGEIMLKTHPLFSHKAYLRNTIILLEPENIQTRVLDDTMYKEDPDRMKKAGQIALDGIKEEYLTELGWEFHFPETFMELNGVGSDGNNV